jgi:hypothetical protein
VATSHVLLHGVQQAGRTIKAQDETQRLPSDEADITLSTLVPAVTPLTFIGEVLGLNLRWDTEYRDYSWFSSVSSGKCRGSTMKYATTTSFHIISNSSFINHQTIRRYKFWAIESVVK